MAKHALASGKEVSGAIIRAIEQFTPDATPADSQDVVQQLAAAHKTLSEAVAPATPGTIVLFHSAEGGFWSFLGPVRFVRTLILTSVVFLIGFIAITLALSDGGAMMPSNAGLLLHHVLLLTAAGVGGCFSALFQVNTYIVEGTYDRKYESSYWIRLLLGMIAGLILAEVVRVPVAPADQAGPAIQELARPTLAMLGGFSSSIVHRILQRLSETIDSLIQSDPKQAMALRQQEARLHATEQITQRRIESATGLLRLQQQLSTGASFGAIKEEIDRQLKQLMPDTTLEPDLNSIIPAHSADGDGRKVAR